MPQTVNQRRKEVLESCDFHLFKAIDRAFTVWVDIARSHPDLAHYLVDLMVGIERDRFILEQFYHLCWGGRPGWMLQLTEITHRLRKQRVQWAQELNTCPDFGNASAAMPQESFGLDKTSDGR